MALERAEADPELQLIVREQCRNDVFTYFDDWAWTFDPRAERGLRWVPFDLWPKQREYVHWMLEGERIQDGGVVEKCRTAGATWVTLHYFLWRWLFEPEWVGGLGSRKEDLVDKRGDMDSLFEKLRRALTMLPVWMLPLGFNVDKHGSHMLLHNPANGALIRGEAGDQIGRGGRTSVYGVDESAFLARPQLVEASLSETTNCRFDISTHFGVGGTFYQKTRNKLIRRFVFDWWDDPRKDQAWYDHKKATTDPVTFAQEVERDPGASIENVVIPMTWVRAAIEWKPAGVQGAVVAGLDVAEKGTNRSVMIFRQGCSVGDIVDWGQANTTETAWKARDEAKNRGCIAVCYDSVGVGAGVTGTWESAEAKMPFAVYAINGGASPTEDYWDDGHHASDLFRNLRAELWWKLRRRFERTYEHYTGIRDYPESDLISIPDNDALMQDLCKPTFKRTETGKIQIESKADMQKRGVGSPDFADALAYAFAEGGATEVLKLPERSRDRATGAQLVGAGAW